ncbi:MAG: NBR1-Ig-like domain-containing protein [Chloroflexota bacterium]
MSQQASPDSQWVFVEETIPDNSQYAPNTIIHKRWRLRNTGPATWNGSYRVVYVAGNRMGGAESQPLPHEVAPNQEVDIILLLVIPQEAGTHRGDWHIVDGQGHIVQSASGGGGNFWLVVESLATSAGASGGSAGESGVDAGVANASADVSVGVSGGAQAPADSGASAQANTPRTLKPAVLPKWVLGMNLRDYAYTDMNNGIGMATRLDEYQLKHAQKLQELGVKAVRFYGNHMHAETQLCIDRIGKALNVLHAHGIQAVVSLGDALGHSGLYVKGDDIYHTEPPHAYFHKSYFNEGKYHQFYMPHNEKVVKAFGDSDAVLVWEIGNEFVTKPVGATDEDRAGFLRFAREASDMIAANSTQRISTGLLNSRQVGQLPRDGSIQFAKQLYGLPNVDLATSHYYNQDGEYEWAALDMDIAREMGIGYYIGEMGTAHDFGPRPPFYQKEIQFWRDHGAFMVMPWGFSLENQPFMDNRSIIGMIHGDFNDVLSTIRQFA